MSVICPVFECVAQVVGCCFLGGGLVCRSVELTVVLVSGNKVSPVRLPRYFAFTEVLTRQASSSVSGPEMLKRQQDFLEG